MIKDLRIKLKKDNKTIEYVTFKCNCNNTLFIVNNGYSEITICNNCFMQYLIDKDIIKRLNKVNDKHI